MDDEMKWPPYRPLGWGVSFWPFKWTWEICRKYPQHISIDVGPFVFWATWG